MEYTQKEKHKLYMREWRKKNKDKVSKWDKRYRETHELKTDKEYHKRYRINNKKKRNEYNKRWKKENPEKWKSLRDKHQKKWLENNKFIKKIQNYTFHNLLNQIRKRDNCSCIQCGNSDGLETHHTIYKFPPQLDDAITVCNSCHYYLNRK